MPDSIPPARKSQRARQRIYEAAIQCFRDGDSVSMRDIASAAEVSPASVYRYYADKEAIVLQWHGEYIDALADKMSRLPQGQLADRYHNALETTLRELTPMRAAMTLLFSQAMRPDCDASLMRGPQARQLSAAYRDLALTSDDSLREPKATQLGIVLYTFHMLLLIFWLYDRSPNQASTAKLLSFTREFFKLLRPMFFLPMIPQGMARLAEIVMPDQENESRSIGPAAEEDPRDRQ